MLRDRIIEQYGTGCQIHRIRRTPRFHSSLFVADMMQGARLTRLLGAIGHNGQLTEQSGMDLLYPERLVFLYERLMLLAFALVERPLSVLLLGLGGGAMIRHLGAYLPDCKITVVEHDAAVIDLARRYFFIDQPIVEADAQEIVAEKPATYDVILVDLYDGRGVERFEATFWRDCAKALRPGGCIAVNWAAFVDDGTARAEARRLKTEIGQSFFVGPRALSENVVQIVPADKTIALADLVPRWRRFAEKHHLPREDRGVLKQCTILGKFPSKS